MGKIYDYVEANGWKRSCDGRGTFHLLPQWGEEERSEELSHYEIHIKPESICWGDLNESEALADLEMAMEFALSEIKEFRRMKELEDQRKNPR